MATIKEAIEYSKVNPDSAFATELRKRIESGQMNNELESAGLKQYISTPTPQAEPTLGSKLMERGKTIVKEATGHPASDILKNADTTSGKDIAGAGSEALLRTAQAPIHVAGALGGAILDTTGAALHATGLDKPLSSIVGGGINLVDTLGKHVMNAMGIDTSKTPTNEEVISKYNTLPEDQQKVIKSIIDSTGLLGIKPTEAGASVVKNGIENTVNDLSQGIKSGVDAAAPKITPDAEGIMQRVARVSKGKQASFEKQAGESIGSFLDKRGIYGNIDQITQKLYDRFQTSKQTADEALATLQGTYRAPQIRTALSELDGKVERTSSVGAPDADLARVKELVTKERTQGLTMSEVNEVKRLYEKRVRLDYVKTNAPEDVTRATNVDTALRNWQFTEAEKAGLKNLPEINKETMLNKKLLDDIGAEHAGSAGNNAVSLTDWIMLAGGDPTAIGGYLLKKTFDSKKAMSYIASKVSKNKDKIGVPEAKFKEKLQLEAPKQGVTQSGNNVAIKLDKMTQTSLDNALVAKFGKNYTKEDIKQFLLGSGEGKLQFNTKPVNALREISDSKLNEILVKKFGKEYRKALPFEMANALKSLPSPKLGSVKVKSNLPIKVRPTKEKDISKGFPKKA